MSGLFVDAKLGTFPGTLSLDVLALEGAAITPHPAIAISFRSFDTVCGEPVRCAVEVADTILQQGQGMHGSFSRADTWNFMAVQGPDFKSHSSIRRRRAMPTSAGRSPMSSGSRSATKASSSAAF